MRKAKGKLKTGMSLTAIAGTVVLGASFIGGIAAGATLGSGSYNPLTHAPGGAESLFSNPDGSFRQTQYYGYCYYYGYDFYTNPQGYECCYGYYGYTYCYNNTSAEGPAPLDGYIFAERRFRPEKTETVTDAGGFAGSGVSPGQPDYKNTFL